MDGSGTIANSVMDGSGTIANSVMDGSGAVWSLKWAVQKILHR